jgi:SAM-dependent methyltransferase
MLFLGISLLVIILCFGFVLLFGPPYLPTLTKQATIAMDMIDLEAGQTLLELGCGDGKILLAAAKRGWYAVGYELNPLLVVVCKLRTWRYRKLITVRLGNFWTQQWPNAEGIFVFIMPRHMAKLDKKIMQSSRGPVKLISFAFTIPGKKPIKSQDGVHLYTYK